MDNYVGDDNLPDMFERSTDLRDRQSTYPAYLSNLIRKSAYRISRSI